MRFRTDSPAVKAAFEQSQGLFTNQTMVAAMGDPLLLASFSLVSFIQKSLVASVTTQAEAENFCQISKPDLLFTSETLEQGYGIALIERVKKVSSNTKCLLFLHRENQAIVRDAINAHADGVIFVSSIGKGTDGDFVKAMSAVSAGNTYYPKQVREAAGFSAEQLPDLTLRELDVLKCLVSGMSNKEISATLVISADTTKTHVSKIISAFGVKDRTSAVIAAIRRGM